jgi:arginyl-tRNA synthetase
MLKYPETTIELIEKEITKALSKQDELIYKFSINLAKIKVQVELIKNPKYGDFSTNIMMLFGLELKDVIKFGRQIIAILPKHIFQKVEIVNPGFINMFLSKDLNNDLLIQILKQADKYGNFKTKKDFYNIEFVSANPTGLLHIGHARNAAIGDTLARIWNAYGIKVNREYYINDAGNQIDKLAMSTLVRYKQACDQSASLPEDAYHGNEIVQIANQIKAENGQQYVETPYNDNKILDAKTDIFFKDYAKEYLLNIIKKTLLNFGINIDI